MRRFEKTVDLAQVVVGVPVFIIVAALTAAVMAVGFVAFEAADRLRHRR